MEGASGRVELNEEMKDIAVPQIVELQPLHCLQKEAAMSWCHLILCERETIANLHFAGQGLTEGGIHAWTKDKCDFDDADLCPKKLPRQRTPAEINSIREMVASDEFRHVSTDTLARRMGRVFAASSAGVACIDGVDHVIEFTRSSAVSAARLSFPTLRINRPAAGLPQRLLNRKVMCGVVFRGHVSLNDSCKVL